MKEQSIRRAWRVASEIVSVRPWLDISWVSDVEGHLVVHDGPLGAALHFDTDDGATWEPRSALVRELDWEDIAEAGSTRLLGGTDWRECWGAPAAEPQMTGKTAT